MNTFGRDFVRAYAPAAQQASDAINQRMMDARRAAQEKAIMAERMQMEEKLRAQRERERQLNDLRRGLAELNVDPSKFGDDPIALSMATFNARNAFEELRNNRQVQKEQASRDAAASAELRRELDAFGVGGQFSDEASARKALRDAKANADVEQARRTTAARVAEERARMPAAQKNAETLVNSLVASGDVTEEEADQVRAQAMANGGRLPGLREGMRDDVNFAIENIARLQPLYEQVQSLGPDAKSYFGPVDARLKSVAGSMFGGEDVFRGIEQRYNEVGAQRAFSQGGKALTAHEIERIYKQIGNLTDADFDRRISDYYQRTVRDAEVLLDNLRRDPVRFSPEGKSAIERLERYVKAGANQGVKSDRVNPDASAKANPADEILAKYGIK